MVPNDYTYYMHIHGYNEHIVSPVKFVITGFECNDNIMYIMKKKT